MNDTIKFNLNGKAVSLKVEPARPLLWVLRYDLGLTATKYGCGGGLCGACTVIIDGQAVRSCLVNIKAIAGKEVTTLEGLVQSGKLHPLQKAFIRHDALQCGYCTPGMIMNAYGLLLKNPAPSKREIVEQMEGNLCRCGAHTRIIRAIQSAAQAMGGARG